MTNEELVAAIQAGKAELYEQLWEQVERLVAWKASRVIRVLGGQGGVEFGDLYNSCYPAMLEAVKTYKPATGAFSTWFMYYIKTTLADVAGYRTVKMRKDPLRCATSLSTPIGGEDNDGTLSDITADPKGQLSLDSVEARIMFEQIQIELNSALEAIPEDCRNILQQRYFQQKTLAEVGQDMGKTAEEIQSLEQKGIRAMRQPRIAKRLRPLYEDFDFYSFSGLGSFRNCSMSVQEKYVIQQEKSRDK